MERSNPPRACVGFLLRCYLGPYQASIRARELGIAALVGGRGVEPARAGNEADKKPAELELNLLHETVERLTCAPR